MSYLLICMYFTEKLVEQLVSLALRVEGELSISDLESKLSKDTVQLVRIALGSLNEPAYTAWVGMVEYAKSRGTHISNTY